MLKTDPRRFKTPEIVAQRGRPRVLVILLLLAINLAVAWYAFDYGRLRGGFDAGDSGRRVARLEAEIERLQQDKGALRLDAAGLERSAQIDRAAADKVQADLKALHDEKAALMREVAFLKSLLSEGGSHFLVDEFELAAGEETSSYSFSFMVSRREKSNEMVKGKVTLKVEGQLQGKAVALPLEKLTGDGTASLRMGFRHYQRFEGVIVLPVGFIPKTVVVAVRPTGKKVKGISRPFDWNLSVN